MAPVRVIACLLRKRNSVKDPEHQSVRMVSLTILHSADYRAWREGGSHGVCDQYLI